MSKSTKNLDYKNQLAFDELEGTDTDSFAHSVRVHNKRLTPFCNTALVATVVTVAAGPLQIVRFNVFNPSDGTAYLQLFDTTGAVTLGTTVPTLSMEIDTLKSFFDNVALGGYQFTNGLKIAATTLPKGLTAPSTGLVVNIGYSL